MFLNSIYLLLVESVWLDDKSVVNVYPLALDRREFVGELLIEQQLVMIVVDCSYSVFLHFFYKHSTPIVCCPFVEQLYWNCLVY